MQITNPGLFQQLLPGRGGRDRGEGVYPGLPLGSTSPAADISALQNPGLGTAPAGLGGSLPEPARAGGAAAGDLLTRSLSRLVDGLPTEVGALRLAEYRAEARITEVQGSFRLGEATFQFRAVEAYYRVDATYKAQSGQFTEAVEERQGPDGSDPFAVLREYFSPENTAQRIFDFAKLRYVPGEDRQEYSDYILPAVEKGFSEARAILGDLPADVDDQIDRTFDLVHEFFRKFVEGEGGQEAPV